jgi:hypothetical protein
MITTILATAVAPLPALDVPRFLSCVRQIEGHRWSDPGGAYAIQAATWRQHSRMPYALASVKVHADHVAALHLDWLGRSLRADGFPVNAYTLACAWRWGFDGFKARAQHGLIEYGERVWNLYNAGR